MWETEIDSLLCTLYGVSDGDINTIERVSDPN